jgi:hypothetical protein
MKGYSYIKTFVSFVCFSLLVDASFAQQKEIGSWITVTLKQTSKSKWSSYGEFQIRSLSPYSRFYYNEIKTGITYSFNKTVSATLGTGYYNTFNEGEKYDNYYRKKEFRIWQQLILKQDFFIALVEHRFRIEQQFADKYSNRLRYRLNVNVPINNKESKPKTFFISINDEVFFTNKLPHFSRNRFYGGSGYVFNKNFTLQAGVLRQVDFSVEKDRRKNYLFTSFTYSF